MGLILAAVRRKLKENIDLLKDYDVVDEEGQGMVIVNKNWIVNNAMIIRCVCPKHSQKIYKPQKKKK